MSGRETLSNRTSTFALYRDVFAILPRSARWFLASYAIALGLLALLDAAALGLIAAVTSPVLSGGSVSLPLVGAVSDGGLLVVLGLVCLLLMLKSAGAVLLLRAATRRFALYEQALGSRLFDQYLRAPWTERLRWNSADLVRATDASVAATISSFLLPGAGLFGEIATSVAIIAVLAFTEPLLAAVIVVYLGLLGLVLFIWITGASKRAGRRTQQFARRNVRLVTEMIGALKEITLRNKGPEVAAVVQENRVKTSQSRASIQFLGQVPRFVLDAGIIGGVLIVGLIGAIGGGVTGAISAVAIFGLAGFRMAPAVVRTQAVASQVVSNQPHAELVLGSIREIDDVTAHLADRQELDLPSRPEALAFDEVWFRYGPDAPDVLENFTLDIPFGSDVAFVGASGAGKSTVIDLVLGLLEPTRGRIHIDGLDLRDVTTSWRSRVGYVPQEVSLFDASIAQNVALSWSPDGIDRDRVEVALERAQLLQFVKGRVGGIDALVGERGLALSGGQRQRLGIARALYAQPLVLVLDEATSSLDTSTEAAVTSAIRGLGTEVTTITVAHRLATIRDADIVFYLDNGRLRASGAFEEVTAAVPEFEMQARLAGLLPT